jgi:cleavage and polyadenylation specificity factor subunit 2
LYAVGRVAEMLTFTPLSGAAKSSRTSPLAYLLQVDDINILLDCGSPDWCPEPPSSRTEGDHVMEDAFPWEQYCDKLRECVVYRMRSGVSAAYNCSYRIAPTVDLVLLSHGDLAHSGLYPYAYARWGLKAPAYSTLPVQAMARIAATEEADGIRDEEDVGSAEAQATPKDGGDPTSQDPSTSLQDIQPEESLHPQTHPQNAKYVATPQEVHDSFDAINTLRYSQPAHLSGENRAPAQADLIRNVLQDGVRG